MKLTLALIIVLLCAGCTQGVKERTIGARGSYTESTGEYTGEVYESLYFK